MAISSKEIIILLLSIIGSILIGLSVRDYSKTSQLKDFLGIIITIIIGVFAVIFIVYRKFKEINDELENQKKKQVQLDEKLKIYKRLAKIEKKIGI